MKYKVGDKVKIREDLLVEHLYGGRAWVTQGMYALGGKIATIVDANARKGTYCIDLGGSYVWTAEMFEDMNEQGTHRSVTISVVENKVIAYCDNKMGVARCHPDDTFDFFVGAKIALERLKEAEKPYGWLKEGVKYYTPAFGAYDEDDDLWLMSIYRGESIDKMNMKRGIAFKTREEAIACAKKMLAAVKQEG